MSPKFASRLNRDSGGSSLRGHNNSFIEEQVRNLNRSIENSTWIVTQVNDQASQHCAGLLLNFVGHFVDRTADLIGSSLVELAQPDIAIPGLQNFMAHAHHLNFLPRQVKRQ
jgi:hypothetical protein